MTGTTQKKGEAEIANTAQFMASAIGRAHPSTQIGAAAVLLSSLLITVVPSDKRVAMLDKLAKEMRHQIKQAEIKERKAKKL